MEKRAFILNTIYWHELAGKLNVQPIENILNEHIDLSDYGDGIQRIYFTFIAVRTSNTIHENDAKYNPKTKVLEVALRLSYKHLVGANESKITEMMVHLFLVAVDLYKGLGVEAFDLKSFRKDTKQVFSKLVTT